MTVALFVLILALVVYGLERNHLRQPQPRQRLAGSTDARARDTYRVWIH
jgi:hypothetical protein